MRDKKGILFAADIPDERKLIELIQEVEPYIQAIKIGNQVLYRNSWTIIEKIKAKSELPIIADLKLLDMPNMVGRITQDAVNAGVDGLMVAGAIGIAGINTCREYLDNKLLFLFTQLTHCDGLIGDDEADKYIDYAIGLGCDGIQVPATKKERIKIVREKVKDKLMIISCGIGTQKFYDSDSEGPAIGSAIKEGADYEIIGRSIYSNTYLIARDAANLAKKMIQNCIKI